MESEIRKYNGVPTLFVNGKPASCHWCYCSPEYADQFVRAGIRIFTFSLPGYMHKDKWWLGPDKYDFSSIYRRLDAFKKAAPDALFVPRIHTGYAESQWFADMFPEECNLAVRFDNGQPHTEYRHRMIGKPQHSMASKKWLEMSSIALKEFISEVENHSGDRVIGYHIGGGFTAEWFTWHIVNYEGIDDYSEPMRQAFRRFVEKKYKNEDNLRQAWDIKDIIFDTVEIPDVFRRQKPSLGAFYSTELQQDIIDYQECFGHEEAVSCIYLCRTAKDILKWKKIIGVFNGYFLVFDRTLVPQRSGHLGFNEILDSDAIDFISSPYIYEYRGYGQNHHPQTLAVSVQANGKLYVDEIDTAPPHPGFFFDWVNNIVEPENITAYCETLKRDFAFNMATGTSLWWMDLGERGWFSPEPVTKTLKTLIHAEEILANEEKGTASEIAVVLDYDSYKAAYPMPTHQETYIAFLTQWEMPRIGAPFDVIFLEDFLQSKSKYKLAIFPQTALLDAKRGKTLVEFLRENKISTIWFHAPGYATRDESIQKIIGWKWEFDGQALCNVTIRNPQHWLTEGVAEGTEYGAEIALAERQKHSFKWVLNAKESARKVIIDDNDAEFVGALTTGEGVGLAVKEKEGAFSILSSAPAMPTLMLRNAANKAGVHLYASLGDIIFAGKHFLGIQAGFDGEHEISLPAKYKVINLQAEEIIGNQIEKFSVNLRYGECALYALLGKTNPRELPRRK